MDLGLQLGEAPFGTKASKPFKRGAGWLIGSVVVVDAVALGSKPLGTTEFGSKLLPLSDVFLGVN
jgi:hypothetical protein